MSCSKQLLDYSAGGPMSQPIKYEPEECAWCMNTRKKGRDGEQ